jgi:hypothetical protein
MADVRIPETPEVEPLDESEPFGSWLAAVSRPGVDLTEILDLLLSAPLRTAFGWL